MTFCMKCDSFVGLQEILRQREKLLMDRLHRAYRRAESQLISVLERRKGEVQTFYGDLMLADGVYGGSQSRRWKVDWNKTPQPIQVKLMSLRGVRDKLPGQGHFHCVSQSLSDIFINCFYLFTNMKGSVDSNSNNVCCVILINDHMYSNLVKVNLFSLNNAFWHKVEDMSWWFHFTTGLVVTTWDGQSWKVKLGVPPHYQ